MIRIKKEFAPVSIHFETVNDLMRFKALLIQHQKNENQMNNYLFSRHYNTSVNYDLCTELLKELE